MDYLLEVEKDGDALVISMPAIPEFNAVAYSDDDINTQSLEAFELALDFYTETKRPIPLGENVNSANYSLSVPTTLTAKIYLYNEWLNSKQTKTELALKVGTPKQNFNRLFDFKYKSKIETIESALAAMGRRLDLTLS